MTLCQRTLHFSFIKLKCIQNAQLLCCARMWSALGDCWRRGVLFYTYCLVSWDKQVFCLLNPQTSCWIAYSVVLGCVKTHLQTHKHTFLYTFCLHFWHFFPAPSSVGVQSFITTTAWKCIKGPEWTHSKWKYTSNTTWKLYKITSYSSINIMR